MTAYQICLATIVCVAGIFIIMAPVIRYVSVGWRAKRREILDCLNADARLDYFKMFCRAQATPDASKCTAEFEQMYDRWYGRRLFTVPAVLLCIASSLSVVLMVLSIFHQVKFISINPAFDLQPIAIAALAGAYMWIVNDLTSRSRRLDMAPADVHLSTLRTVVAIPMGYALSSIAAESIGPAIAFSLGAFPLATIASILRKFSYKQLGIEATAEESSDDIIKLQGVNRAISERLSNEDLNTIPQLAYCDPVQITMRSGLGFNFVTDCISQALAWMYFEDSLAKLRPIGLRGAVEIASLMVDFYGLAPEDRKAPAASVLAMAALAIGQDPTSIEETFRQIADDPYTKFLYNIWE